MRSFHIFNNVTGAFGGVSFKSKLSATIRIVIYGPGYPLCKVSAHSEQFEIFSRYYLAQRCLTWQIGRDAVYYTRHPSSAFRPQNGPKFAFLSLFLSNHLVL